MIRSESNKSSVPSADAGAVIRFAEFELDAAKRELRRGRELVELEPKALDLLIYLLEHRDRMVGKEELLEALWGHAAVFESSLTSCMSRLRHALGEHGRLIRTQYGKGYRIVVARGDARGEGPTHAATDAGTGWLRPPFIGRELELKRLRGAFEEACRGRGRLVVLTGVQGIGKTRLVDELSLSVQSRGRVLSGSCPEGIGPPYWPWVQILRAYIGGAHPETLRSELAAGARDVAALVPELRTVLPEITPLPLAAADERPRLFRSLTAFLRRSSRREPMLLILDDLHWADRASLLLLLHVARAAEELALLIVATVREPLSDDGPIREILPSLLDVPGAQSLGLAGLGQTDVDLLVGSIAGRRVDPALSERIADATDGNPFFVEQIALHLIERGDLTAGIASVESIHVPEEVAVVHEERLGRLSAPCRRLLSIAAVAGVRFNLALVTAVYDAEFRRSLARASPEVWPCLEEAVRARVIRAANADGSEYCFAHAFLRESVYRSLGLAEQAALHGRIGECMAALASVEHFEAAEIADHFARGAAVAGVEKALAHVQNAARAAESSLGFEQAVQWYRKGLSILELAPEPDHRRRLSLLIALARAQWNAGRLHASAKTAGRAAHLARRLRDPIGLARAALARGLNSTSPEIDAEYTRTLEEAASTLAPGERKLKARVLGRLAWAHHGSRDRAKRELLGRQALDLLPGLDDVPTMLWTLCEVHAAFTDPDHGDDRLRLANQIIDLAGQHGDRESLALGYAFRARDLGERGEMEAADRDMAACGAIGEEIHHPICRWNLALWRTLRAVLAGRWVEAERLSRESLAIGREFDPELALLTCGNQEMTLQFLRGDVDELERRIEELLGAHPLLQLPRAALAYLLSLRGRLEDAVQLADQVLSGGSETLVWDSTLLPTLMSIGLVYAEARDEDRCAKVYDLLAPYDGQCCIVGINPTVCYGPVSRTLAWLAANFGRTREAEAHREAALVACRRMDAEPWLAETCFESARALRMRGTRSDRSRAASFLNEARTLARELGMAGLLGRIEALG